MVTCREKELQDKIALLEAQLKVDNPEKRSNLVRAIFNNIYMSERAGQRGILIPLVMPKSPDNYVCGKVYEISECDLTKSHPWWKKAPESNI